MTKETLKNILTMLKSSSGCSLDELERALPERYLRLDPVHYSWQSVLSEIIILLEWRLVEAYHQGQMLSPELLKDYSQWPENISFYISKQAIDMEEALGITLDGQPTSIFGAPQANYSWPEVFVLMPFATNLKPVYDDHIKNVVTQLGLQVGRADDFFLHGSIISDVWSAINAARIIIADCTGRNPNVFYEIGIAHTLGKDTILITQSIDDVPFDLRHLRVLVYEYTPRKIKEFENALSKTITNLSKKAT